VRTFKVHLHDRRRHTPSMHLLRAKDREMAEAIADDLLEESANHVAVELWDGKRRVYSSARL
jgi:hypothetical protein